MKSNKAIKGSLTRRKVAVGYWFILPFLIGFAVIFLPAIIYSIYYSFCRVGLIEGKFSVIPLGVQNYIDLFLTDVNYRVFLLNAIKGIFVDSSIILIFSFFIANVLNQKFVGRTISRTVLFIPVILATGLIAEINVNNSLFHSVYDSNTGSEIVSGFVSSGNSFFNLEHIVQSVNLGEDFNNIILSAVKNVSNIVNCSGVQILIFLSGLQAIPQSVFEAAKVEGATSWETFWKITFPMLSPMILVNAIYTIVDTFTQPSYGMLNFIQNTAFEGKLDQMGYASAMSWVYFLVVIVVLAVVALIGNKTVKYND